MRGPKFTIGQLSDQTGVHIETVRYYERINIVPKPERTSGGRRIYTEEEVKRYAFIARGRQLGFSLNEIRSLLSLVDEKTFSCSEVRDITLDHAETVKKKVADLKKIERLLRTMAAQCEGGQLPECPIIETLSDTN